MMTTRMTAAAEASLHLSRLSPEPDDVPEQMNRQASDAAIFLAQCINCYPTAQCTFITVC